MKMKIFGLPAGLLLAIMVGLALVLFFGWRAMSSLHHLRGAPMRRAPDAGEIEKIRGWMTIPYVARLYDVPEKYLWAQVGISPVGNEAKSLAELTVIYYPDQGLYVLNRVKLAVHEFFLRSRPPRPDEPPLPGRPELTTPAP